MNAHTHCASPQSTPHRHTSLKPGAREHAQPASPTHAGSHAHSRRIDTHSETCHATHSHSPAHTPQRRVSRRSHGIISSIIPARARPRGPPNSPRPSARPVPPESSQIWTPLGPGCEPRPFSPRRGRSGSRGALHGAPPLAPQPPQPPPPPRPPRPTGRHPGGGAARRCPQPLGPRLSGAAGPGQWRREGVPLAWGPGRGGVRPG